MQFSIIIKVMLVKGQPFESAGLSTVFGGFIKNLIIYTIYCASTSCIYKLNSGKRKITRI